MEEGIIRVKRKDIQRRIHKGRLEVNGKEIQTFIRIDM